MPLDDYVHILQPYGYGVDVRCGTFDSQASPLKRRFNPRLLRNKAVGHAPYLVLSVAKESSQS